MAKVILTGCTGQDGSYMAEYLLSLGHEVFGLTRRVSNPNLDNIKVAARHSNFKFVSGDLSDTPSIYNVVKDVQPDYFINFAAQSHVHESWKTPESTFNINALGVLRCLEAIRQYAPKCKFYSAGSSEEWGDVQYSPQDDKHPKRARSPYAASKVAAGQLVKVYRESYGLFAIHGILYNHESPRRAEQFVTRKITKGVSKIWKAIQDGKDFDPIVLGNLDAKRDWSHALDFIWGIWLMMNQDEPKEYILSSGETHSIREFIEKAFIYAGLQLEKSNCLGKEEYTVNGKPAVTVSQEFYRPAEVDLLLGDSSKARVELNWTPRVTFDRLVMDMVGNDIDLLCQK